MDSDVNNYASSLLREAREEVGRADSKVAILLAAAGVAGSVLVGAVLAGGHLLRSVASGISVLLWLGLGGYGLGVFVLGLALIPRTRHPADGSEDPYFFGDVATYQTPQTLVLALERAAKSPTQRTVDQLWVVSRIVVRKYQLLRVGMLLLAAGVMLGGVALLFAGRAA